MKLNLILLLLIFSSQPGFSVKFSDLPSLNQHSQTEKKPILTPTQPNLNARSFILIDSDSGQVLASYKANERHEPASLTKMMAMYVISDAIKQGRLKLNQTIKVSKNAWKLGGSRMFLKEGQDVLVEDLVKGIIVQSGNDATVALAEYLAGSENAFVDLMNQQAQFLGMKDTHFVTCTGMPDENHYSTAKDMAILARATIEDHPEHYLWYKQKWFTYNDIKQPNRNRLLWRDEDIDGIKTGHTKSAGHCLAASAKKKNMRLIAVLLGSNSEESRANDTQRLLNYGFRFFETHHLYDEKQALMKSKIWFGKKSILKVGLKNNLSITIPLGSYKQLQADLSLPKVIKAPIQSGQKIGTLRLSLNGEQISEQALVALDTIETASLWKSIIDKTKLVFYKWFKMNTQKV